MMHVTALNAAFHPFPGRQLLDDVNESDKEDQDCSNVDDSQQVRGFLNNSASEDNGMDFDDSAHISMQSLPLLALTMNMKISMMTFEVRGDIYFWEMAKFASGT